MKKKILATFVAAVMTMSLAACGLKIPNIPGVNTSTETSVSDSATLTEASTPSSTETSTSQETVTEYQQPWYEEYVSLYYPVLQDFYNMAYLGIEPMNENFYQSQGDTMWMSDDEKAKFGFWFEDINEDGTMEMLIGREDVVNAVCGMRGDGPCVYIGAGYRSMMTIYENGLIVYEGSSGASSYSYDYFYLDGQKLVLQEFFYTDYDLETDSVLYYHNTTGAWDDDPADVITEDEFNVMTEIGLEARNYSDKWIPMFDYANGLLYVAVDGVTIDELTEEGVTWSLQKSRVVDNVILAEENDTIQTLFFQKDGKATFFKNDSNGEIWCKDVEGDFGFSGREHIYYGLTMPDTSYQSLYIIGFDRDGSLVTQRSYYDFLTGESHVILEYYIKSFG